MPNRDPEPSEDVVRAWARLVRVPQSLLSAVESDLKSQGLPPLSWYDALLELRRTGSAGLRPFELQREMLLAQYNLSRLIARLLAAGHVESLPCEEDRRGQVLKITPQGEHLLEEIWPAYRAAIDKHFAVRLGEKNARALGALLGDLI